MSAFREILKQSSTAKFVVNLARFLKAVNIYRRTGITPDYGYHSARHLYFSTNRRSHDIFAAVQNFVSRHNTIVIENPIGVWGDMTGMSLETVIKILDDVGFHRFDTLLQPEMCNELIEFARTTPSKPRIAGYDDKRIVYDRNNLVANLYDFDAQVLLENPIIQNLITDESLLAVAREFLGSSLCLQNVSMWWSNADFHNVSKNAAAQLYHVDMDTIKWLNFFIYLTDVDSLNGPHCYIARSHRLAPREVYRDGRILDEEISQHFQPEDVIEITGSQGTLLAVDTKGLHKGKVLEKGERLLLQIRFAVNNFGTGAPSKVEINDKFSPEFLSKIERNPSIYKGGYF